MSEYIPGTQIKVKIPCLNCKNGFVELISKDDSAMRLYHRGYCPECSGTQWVEKWISIETLGRWMRD